MLHKCVLLALEIHWTGIHLTTNLLAAAKEARHNIKGQKKILKLN